MADTTASAPVTIKLTKAISHGDKTWSELTFREAELGDVIAADKFDGHLGKTAAVLASMADVPFQAMKRLSMSDMGRIMDQTGHLLGNASEPETTGG